MKNYQWAVVVFIIIFIFVVLITASDDAAEVSLLKKHTETTEYSWYYKPRTDGKQPEKLREFAFVENYNAYSLGSPDEKVIYITFDAGYENGYAPKILDVLKAHNAPAAFFLVKHYLVTNPDIVKRMVAEGHLVCNHSTHHKIMSKMDFESFKQELSGIEQTFFELTGQQMPKYYRPPEGRFSERSLKYAQELGYTTIFWSFAYQDWYDNNQPSVDSAFRIITTRTHPGEIALLHLTSATNAKVLDDVLTEWERQGYSFKSLDYLIETCAK